jgi:hypothetical protein
LLALAVAIGAYPLVPLADCPEVEKSECEWLYSAQRSLVMIQIDKEIRPCEIEARIVFARAAAR